LSDTIGADAPRDRDASVEILSDVEDFDRQSADGAEEVAFDAFDAAPGADGDGAHGSAADEEGDR
jgi:hypothetical protein